LFLDAVQPGATLACRPADARWTRPMARLPIPKVMQYQLDDGWTSVDFVRRTRSWPCTVRRWCP
jgi:glycyl-tRNA synthetase beta chain